MTWFHTCPTLPTLTIYRPAKPGAKRAPAAMCFEMHSLCGPLPTGRHGNGLSLVPSHWFWTAVSQWHQQGKQVDSVGRAVYDPSIPLRDGP